MLTATSAPGALASLVRRVAERVAAGEFPVPYLTADATDGMGVPAHGGVLFGVESEIRLPPGAPETRAALLQSLRRDLRADALPWLVTWDGGDTAHVLSPKLADTPRTWSDLRRALATVTRHGAVPGGRASARIHVGVARYGTAVRPHMSLLRLLRDHSPTLARLATDPHAPALTRLPPAARPVPADGYAETVPVLLPFAAARDAAVTLSAVVGRPDDHVEFRLFDTSLAAAVVQAQVKLALALVRHAADPAEPGRRTPAEPAGQVPAGRPEAGEAGGVQAVLRPDGRVVPGALTVYDLTASPATARLVELLERLFHRAEDVEQQLALATVTPLPGSRALLADERALDRLTALVPTASVALGDRGTAFPPAPWLADHYAGLGAPAMGQFAPERPFRVPLDLSADGTPAVFDGLSVSPAQFAALLRRTGWPDAPPGTGLALLFVHGGRPPEPGHWPTLLVWVRTLAAELATHVYVWVGTGSHLREVPETLLAEYRAFGRPETVASLRNWRSETAATFVLRHVPRGAAAPRPAALADLDGRPAGAERPAPPQRRELPAPNTPPSPAQRQAPAERDAPDERHASGERHALAERHGSGERHGLGGWHASGERHASAERQDPGLRPADPRGLGGQPSPDERHASGERRGPGLRPADPRGLGGQPGLDERYGSAHRRELTGLGDRPVPDERAVGRELAVGSERRELPGPGGQPMPRERRDSAELAVRSERTRLPGRAGPPTRPEHPRASLVDRIHVEPIEWGAILCDPAMVVSPRYAAAAATYVVFSEPTFVAGIELDPRVGGPVAHDHHHGRAVSLSPESFAALLPEIGFRSDGAVALWFNEESWPDLPGLVSWTRTAAEALGVPVYLDVDGADLVRLPESAVDGFELYARADAVIRGVDWRGTPPPDIWLRYDPLGRRAPATKLVPLAARRLRRFTRIAS